MKRVSRQGGANLGKQIADAVLGFVKNLLPTLLAGFAAVLGVAWLPAKVKEIICLAGQKVKALIVRLLCKATKKLRELWNKLLKKNPKLAAQLGGAGCNTKDDDTCNSTPKQKPCSKGSCFPSDVNADTLDGPLGINLLQIEQEMRTLTAAEREKLNWPAIAREDFTGCRVIHLMLDRGDEDCTDVKLLRTPEWLADHVCDMDGNSVYRPDENGNIDVKRKLHSENLRCWLNMPDMGVEGLAVVISIEERPGDRPGYAPTPIPLENASEYRRITGTFEHSRGKVYDYKFEGESKALGSTATHPFWSYDRNAWIAVGDLRIGERVHGLDGRFRLESVQLRPKPQQVYTVEVEGDHVFRVGEQGILVHNASDKEDKEVTCLFKSCNEVMTATQVPPCPHNPTKSSVPKSACVECNDKEDCPNCQAKDREDTTRDYFRKPADHWNCYPNGERSQWRSGKTASIVCGQCCEERVVKVEGQDMTQVWIVRKCVCQRK